MSNSNNQESDLSLLSNEIHRISFLYSEKINKYRDSFFYTVIGCFSLLCKVLCFLSVSLLIVLIIFLNKANLIHFWTIGGMFLGTLIVSQLSEILNPVIYSEDVNSKTFFSKINKIKINIKKGLLKRIFLKNELKEVNNLNSLINDFYTKFTPEIKDKILNFYKNNPYKFGTPENIILNNSYQKIQELLKCEDYIEVFSIYQNDQTKYSYDSMEKYY